MPSRIHMKPNPPYIFAVVVMIVDE